MSKINPSLPSINCLPKDGIAYYFGPVFNAAEQEHYFKELLNSIGWESDYVTLFGKTHITDRKMAFYGDHGVQYKYAGKGYKALEWTEELIELKKHTEFITGENYNACLLNLYHSGKEGMGWHSDNEQEMISMGSIASLSFGATRPFYFKHRITGEKHQIDLEQGSLLEMKGETQRYWLHQLPKRLRITTPRINVTFRQFSMD